MAAATTGAASGEDSDILETPILDAERPNLLQKISEEGGYAYVRMASLAALGDFRAAEAAREMAWEQLHSGPWHAVLPIWRDAYSMACLHVARLHYKYGEFKEALRALDMGLIMGGTVLRKDLDSAVEKVSTNASAIWGLSEYEGSVKGRPLWNGEDCSEAEFLRVLPIRSLSCKVVERRSGLSLEGFLCDYFLPGYPVIIADGMAHWPARSKWNDLNYLKKVPLSSYHLPIKLFHLCTWGNDADNEVLIEAR